MTAVSVTLHHNIRMTLTMTMALDSTTAERQSQSGVVEYKAVV
jgi:hypothetical protein